MKIHYIKLPIIFLSMFFLALTVNAQDDCSTTGFKVDYKTKPSGTYAARSTRTICQLPEFYENAPVIATNIYGSRTDKQTTATGYFYTKMINGRWWVVDPNGYLNICRAVNNITKGNGTTSTTAFATKFADSNSNWMTTTKQYLKGIGFNCAGSWSTTSTITSNATQETNPLAYTIILNWMSGYGTGRTVQQAGQMGYPNDCIFVFEQGFVNYCETQAQTLVANKLDKNLFGYFTDNELPFKNANLTGYLNLGVAEPLNENYLAAKQWLTDNGYTTADATNTDVQKRFLGFVGKTYFSIVYNAIKKYDPNHMSLGPRVDREETRANSYFMQAVGPYVDILAINYYREWTPNSAFMTDWGTNLNKPFMITEFYTKGEDSGLANTTGAGWVVKTQLDRGYEYQNYTLALLESKYCVGWHWFKYMDNDPTVVSDPSNIDGNKGIFKINYEPYTDLVQKMQEINLSTYNLIDYFDYKAQFPPVIIYPEADAYYKDQVNYGFDDRLGIKNTTSSNKREAFLRFNLTGLNTNVGDVNLYLSVLNPGAAGMTYRADFLTDDSWTEGGITMANHPTNDAEIGRWSDGFDVRLNVESPFLETINSDKKLSINLSGVNTTNAAQIEYASRENPTISLRPRIEISQNGPDGSADLDKLSELIVKNQRVAAFQPDVLFYNITLPSSTTVNPSIVFVKSNASMQVLVTNPVNVLSVLASDRVATITTTSADGTKTKTYTLQFIVEAVTWTGALSTAYEAPGNWFTNVVPSPTNTITIPAGLTNYPVINTNQTIAGGTLVLGASLTVTEGKVLTNTGTLNNTGDLILKSSTSGTASLLSDTSVDNVTQQRYLTSVQRGWRLLSNPVSTKTFNALATASTITLSTDYTGAYVPATNTWTSTDGTVNMTAQQAYKVFITGKTGEAPTYGTGPTNVTLVNKGTATNAAPLQIATTSSQFYLVANPYTAPISLRTILALPANSTLSKTVSYYNPTVASTDVKVKFGGYITKDTSGSLVSGDANDVVIPPMGAIFVQASSGGTLDVPKSAIFTGTNSSGTYTHKTAQATVASTNGLKIEVNSGGTYYDTVAFKFKAVGDAASNIDFGKLPNTVLDAYSITGANKMAVSELELVVQTIPLGITSTIQKSYTFKVVENTIPAGFEAVLVDNLLNTNTVLVSGTNYNFTIDSTPASQGDARFAINLKTVGSLSIAQNELEASIQVYPNPSRGEFNISNTLEGAATIEISSINGQVIHTQKLNSGTTTIQTKSWATGVYILKASSNGIETTKKLIVQ